MRDSYWQLFLRFLRFGLLAWGGPVAQIAMLRQELVEEEGWITRERFNRVLAVYQVLPGPEATELCVYFGMIARGRSGGFLAGFAFVLPGFLAMFALSWLYVSYGLSSPLLAGLFYGFKPAVAALIIRAIHRIGSHALTNRWLWGIGLASAMAALLGVHFLLILLPAGLLYALVKRQLPLPAAHAAFLLPLNALAGSALQTTPSLFALFGYGLRSGLLTFGGAYTVIPFLQRDAVEIVRWMTNTQFLDGLALSGILPAPLIIFATFAGYLGGGPLGALALTAGIFVPAFAFTLVAHDQLERLVDNTAAHAFLDGVTAGVVGLIAAASLSLLQAAIPDWPAALIFLLSLFLVFWWKAKAAVAVVVIGAGLLGILFK
jgi:chromate transporter